MKRIYYSNGSVLTGDYIADAILDLAQVVASRGASTSVDIPVVLPNGVTGQAQLLLSPVSSLLSVTEAVIPGISRSWDEDHTREVVKDVRASIRLLCRRSTAVSIKDSDGTAYIPDFGGL